VGPRMATMVDGNKSYSKFARLFVANSYTYGKNGLPV
jgi:hypothetical protein